MGCAGGSAPPRRELRFIGCAWCYWYNKKDLVLVLVFFIFVFCLFYFLFLLHCSYRLFDFAGDFLFCFLVSCRGAWVRRDDFLDLGCKVGSHTSAAFWFVGDFLAHVF